MPEYGVRRHLGNVDFYTGIPIILFVIQAMLEILGPRERLSPGCSLDLVQGSSLALDKEVVEMYEYVLVTANGILKITQHRLVLEVLQEMEDPTLDQIAADISLVASMLDSAWTGLDEIAIQHIRDFAMLIRHFADAVGNNDVVEASRLVTEIGKKPFVMPEWEKG